MRLVLVLLVELLDALVLVDALLVDVLSEDEVGVSEGSPSPVADGVADPGACRTRCG